MSRIGLFGGTFDPPHLGHIILASEALHELKLDKILWILTPRSPLKINNQISPLEQRLELVNAALRGIPEFRLSLVDVQRESPYYAVDTVNILKNENPGDAFIYLMGSDSLRDLPRWHEPAAFIDSVNELGVYRRPEAYPDLDVLETVCPGIKTKTTFFNAPMIEISGADIRQRIKDGRPFRYFLLPSVYQNIKRHSYYGA
ncbi:MAG: nicotinate (nicotinamide) nucleotide adenylyltransferase [Chloroflexi bacterium]|nr:nicotinate (nicotinamide) nucleotide adenylyltransferase [Chloroflexota bacterium]BCY19239.1 nicotinate-nucleotide adenylyltransferase [Leptolinea sp. HRD-7]